MRGRRNSYGDKIASRTALAGERRGSVEHPIAGRLAGHPRCIPEASAGDLDDRRPDPRRHVVEHGPHRFLGVDLNAQHEGAGGGGVR